MTLFFRVWLPVPFCPKSPKRNKPIKILNLDEIFPLACVNDISILNRKVKVESHTDGPVHNAVALAPPPAPAFTSILRLQY